MTEARIIKELADIELSEAKKKNLPFQTDHEAWAVIWEEVEEAEEELEKLKGHMQAMWAKIRKDEDITDELTFAQRIAIDVAREAIQVAAMCEKGMERRKGGCLWKD